MSRKRTKSGKSGHSKKKIIDKMIPSIGGMEEDEENFEEFAF